MYPGSCLRRAISVLWRSKNFKSFTITVVWREHWKKFLIMIKLPSFRVYNQNMRDAPTWVLLRASPPAYCSQHRHPLHTLSFLGFHLWGFSKNSFISLQYWGDIPITNERSPNTDYLCSQPSLSNATISMLHSHHRACWVRQLWFHWLVWTSTQEPPGLLWNNTLR